MKVLFLIDTLQTGGAEKSLCEMASRFRQVEPVFCQIYPGDSLLPMYRAAGLTVHQIGLRKRYGFLRAVRAVGQVIRQVKPDVLHTTLYRASMVGRMAGRRAGLPVVDSLVNETYSPQIRQALGPVRAAKLRVLQMLDLASARWVARFVANSESAKAAGCRELRIAPERIEVIHRGRDPADLVGGPEDGARKLRAELGLGATGPVLLNVGRLVHQKGQADLLQAFAVVSKQIPDAWLLIAGEGPFRERLEARARERGVWARTRFLGTRSDVPELLRLADVFVFPSLHEGLPGAMLEAMFASVPIVASDIPTHRECVEHGQSALLVPVQDVEALGAAVVRILGQPELGQRFVRRARETALERFDVRRAAERHEELYRRILDAAGR